MTNEEINRYIHEQIMGKCAHPNRRRYINPGPVFTERCTDCYRLATVPDYCSDDSPRRLLNEVVVCLLQRLPIPIDERMPSVFYNEVGFPASAEQIARACVEAHKEGK